MSQFRRDERVSLIPIAEQFLLRIGAEADAAAQRRSTSSSKREKVMNKRQMRQLQKEAQKRAEKMAVALRGEKERNWFALTAAFSTGLALGGVIGALVARATANTEISSDLQNTAAAAKKSVKDAASRVKEKATSAAEEVRDSKPSSAESDREAEMLTKRGLAPAGAR